MLEVLRRLAVRPVLAVEMLAASLFANVLALATPIFVIQVLNRYVAHGVDSTLATLTGGAVIAIVLEFGFRRVRLRFAEAVNSKPDEALSLDTYAVLTGAKAAAMDMLPPGLRREVLSGGDTIRQAFSAPHLCTLMDVPFALLFLGALLLLHPLLAFVAGGFVLAVFLAVLVGMGSMRGLTKAMSQAGGRRGVLIDSAIDAADAVRVFNAAGFLRRRWAQGVRVLDGLKRRIGSRQNAIQGLIQSAHALMTIAMISLAALLVVRGELDVGTMIGANILALRALVPLASMAQMTEGWARARQARDMFAEFSRLPREREDGTAIGAYSGRVGLTDVTFAYPGSQAPLFEQLDFELQPGEVLVVTGANGSGKTTLARLLVGLLEPVRGHVLVDGIDLAQVAPAWWRQQIVYLPQEPRFLGASLRENFLAFREDLDAAAIHALLGRVGLQEFVDRHADGLDMPLLNGGTNLSLGMRRRLALARGLAHDGKLVILDEPTEGLDAEGAAHVYAVMNQLASEGHTIIAFSHDAQIMRGAHHVLDLNEKPVPKFSTLAQMTPPRAANLPEAGQ